MSPGFGQAKELFTVNDYVRALKYATDVMLTEVTSPVAASRYYAYINLAANETIALFDKQQPHFTGVVNGLATITMDTNLLKKSDLTLAAILALYKSSIRLLPSGYLLKNKPDSLTGIAKKRKLPAEKIAATVELVDKVIEQVLRYVSADGFAKLSGLRRFTPSKGDEYWQPTAPAFMPP